MRIERVTLKNYRSFSDCDLDLRGVEHGLLCAGPTGSGKSSLIDAVMWAFFGKSRSRRADGYIKIGADTCSVTVEFAVNGGHYRVTRTRSIKTKAGKSDLQIQSQNGAGWTPLSGKSIPETEAKIEKLIGVGYDVLTSGNFSLQGQADKLSRASVSERIAVLSDLLGLSIYQTWRETAGRQARDLDREAATLEAQVLGAESALAQRDEILERKARAAQNLAAAREMSERATDQRREAEREIATLEAQLPALQKEQAAFAGDRHALMARGKARGEKQAKIDRLTQIVGKRAEIAAKADESSELTCRVAETELELTRVTEERKRIQDERNRLVQANLEAHKHNAAIDSEAKRVKTELAGLAPLIAGHEKRSQLIHEVPCDGISVEVESRGPGTFQLAVLCPLLKDARESCYNLGKLLGRRDSLQSWQADPPLPESSTVEIDKRLYLLDGSYNNLRTQIAFDREAIKGLARWTVLMPELAHADAEIPGLEAEIATLDAEIAALTTKLAGEQDLLGKIAQAQERLSAAKVKHAGLEIGLRAVQAHERDAIQTIAEATAKIAGLDALAQQAEQAKAEAQRIRARHAQMVALELFYRQAPLMVLENDALPAIETEANRLLARISATGMRLQLRTQREIKSRDTLADGLDIIITDQVGEREYEAYSGGQQFQIDLALRVALAKLQARKAGASIQTLICDEGFGTQSAECLDGIIAALRAVQEDFPLLWVISHVEALKDVFPARIEVRGGPQESVAELVVG